MHTNNPTSAAPFATAAAGQPSFQHRFLSLAIWLIALVLTIISIVLRSALRLLMAVTGLSFRWLLYLVLGTALACTVVILAALSIITLGAVSLP